MVPSSHEIPHEVWTNAEKRYPFKSFKDLNQAKSYAVIAAKNSQICYELCVRSIHKCGDKSGIYQEIAYMVYPRETVRKLTFITKSKR